MKGYWNHPEETAAVLRSGWLLTGDIAKMDEDGFFSIVDRKKDLILCSGYNVYPREVEEVLFMHPAVAEAAAIGVPDAYRGESVKAFVVLKGGAHATEGEIVAFCKGGLAASKVPKAFGLPTVFRSLSSEKCSEGSCGNASSRSRGLGPRPPLSLEGMGRCGVP